ncbi:hypothetical protein DFJ74DRAFT_646359 [Hyaloraphidium curvatum]|nr:hypothetical protein DFJ74DRAFT_646359 [Hyaloraphidium curvatum]
MADDGSETVAVAHGTPPEPVDTADATNGADGEGGHDGPVEGAEVENMEGQANGQLAEDEQNLELLVRRGVPGATVESLTQAQGSGSLQVSVEAPGMIHFSLKDFKLRIRAESKLPPTTTKTLPPPAPAKEKRRDPFNILPMGQMLQTAGNYVGTAEWRLARDDVRATQVLNRIDDMKARDLWSFRQLKRHVAPPRTKTHWDFLLDEMQWLREDFRQERRWKIAAAFTVSRWIMEWHNAPDKSVLCVKRVERSPDSMLLQPSSPAAAAVERVPSPAPDQQKKSRKRRRDSDEVMEDSERKAEEADGVAPGGSADVAGTDKGAKEATDAINEDGMANASGGEEQKDEATPMDTDGLPPEGRPSAEDPPDDDANDAHTTSRGKTPTIDREPTRLIIRSNPGLTHVDIGIGSIPDDIKTVYAISNHTLDQPYIDPLNNANVVPMSRMMGTKTKYSDIRWDQYGQDRVLRKRMRTTRGTEWKLEAPCGFLRAARLFCRLTSSSTALIAGPFFTTRKARDDKEKRGIPEPNQPRPVPRGIPQTVWTQEEEDVLLSFGKLYQHNWVLISELMAAEHMPKTAWDCYEKFVALESIEQRARPKVARVDAKDRLLKHQKIIGYILKRIRTRDPRPSAHNQRKVNNNQGIQKKINLVAHDTHQQAQIDAGVDLGSRALTPLELSQVKARHDQEVRMQQESHRQAQFAGRSAQMQSYGRPMPRPGIAVQAGQAGLPVRVPALQQAALQGRLPPGISPEALKQVMLARAMQQQQQAQQAQAQAQQAQAQQQVQQAAARGQPAAASAFPLQLQMQGIQGTDGNVRQMSATDIQAATAALSDPTLRAQLMARQQAIQAQRSALTPEQLMQLAQLRANNPELAQVVRPQGAPQSQAFQQQRIQLLLQQQQAGLLQAHQLQALQNAASSQAPATPPVLAPAPGGQADQGGEQSTQSPARKRK